MQDDFGTLEKTQHRVTGLYDFKIDFLNEADAPSPEIEAVYFYSTPGWTLSQNGKECPSTESDLKTFGKRHFLTSPVRRLHKGAWAQLQFEARKVMARAFKGEPLKDSYRVRGHSVLRLVTAQGNFDYTLFIDIEFFELPF